MASLSQDTSQASDVANLEMAKKETLESNNVKSKMHVIRNETYQFELWVSKIKVRNVRINIHCLNQEAASLNRLG